MTRSAIIQKCLIKSTDDNVIRLNRTFGALKDLIRFFEAQAKAQAIAAR
jgi:hypothetical protein